MEQVSGEDFGSLTVKPENDVRVGEVVDIEFHYTTGSKAIQAGESFTILWRGYRWIHAQTGNLKSPGYTDLSSTGNATLEVSPASGYDRWLHSHITGVKVTVKAGSLVKGDIVRIVIHKSVSPQPYGMTTPPFVGRINFYTRFGMSDGTKYLDEVAVLNVVSAEPVKLRATLPSSGMPHRASTVTIHALDRWNNISSQYTDRIYLSADDGRGRFETCPYYEVDVEAGTATVDISFGSEGVHYVDLRDKKRNWSARSNPTIITTDPHTNIYFGDIHGKVFFAGGMKEVDGYYEYARDVAKLDFSAITGVSDLLRYPDSGSKPENPMTEEDWRTLQEAARRYNQPGVFVPFLAFEWQSDTVECKNNCPGCEGKQFVAIGDRNVYYLRDDEPFFKPFEPISCSAQKLFDVLAGKDALVIPHHSSAPEKFGGVRPKYVNWDVRNDKLMRLVEIYSKWGASEYPGNPRPLTNYSMGHFVQDALCMGHRVGFIGSSDTHLSVPGGEVKEDGRTLRYAKGGLAAVYAEEKTRGAIFDGLRRRHCYATTGVRILIDFSINGRPMGSEIGLAPDAPREIRVMVAGTTIIEGIDVVRNGRNIHFHNGKGYVEEFTFVDRSDMREIVMNAEGRSPFVYYYIRVTQDDWEMGWSSPVWIDLLLDGG
jgi:hypothetical protein